MSSRNPISASSSPPTCQETHQTPSKKHENSPFEATPDQENPLLDSKNPVEATPNRENPLLLLPDSTKEEVVDAIFLISLLNYKVSVGPLPSFADDPPTSPASLGQKLLDHVNADLESGERVTETLLRDRVLKLRSKYNKVLEEKCGKPDEEDVSTDSEKLVFMLSERIWDPEYDNYGFSGVEVDQEVDVSGDKQCEKDQDQEVFLFPKSSCEDDDDIATLVNLNIYKPDDESSSLSVLDQPAQVQSLADFINSNRKNGRFVDEARLRDKVLKLQTRYKEIMEEKGKNLTDDDFSTYNEHLIFQLSKRVWGKEPEGNV